MLGAEPRGSALPQKSQICTEQVTPWQLRCALGEPKESQVHKQGNESCYGVRLLQPSPCCHHNWAPRCLEEKEREALEVLRDRGLSGA